MSRDFGEASLGSIELFCLAADLESFTSAAHQAGITPAAVSRAIGRLEERLGVRLFVRYGMGADKLTADVTQLLAAS